MLERLGPQAFDADLQALPDWFREHGGQLGAVEILHDEGRPILVATRDLQRDELVMKAPHHLLLSSDVARHSPIGLRLQAGGVTDDQAYFATFLADARHRPGYWRAMIDAAPQDFAHLPERFDRADWALLQGSHVQTLARERWNRLRARYRDVCDLLPRPHRIALHDFAWGWHWASTQRLGLGEGKSARTVLVPLASLLIHAPKRNCNYAKAGDDFEVRADAAVHAGSVLSFGAPHLAGSQLLAHHGLALDDNPQDTAVLSFDLGAGHWLHRFVPTLTSGQPRLAFELGLDTCAKRPRELFSFLRLLSLGNERAARAYPAVASADLPWVSVLDASNERAAMQRLAAACEHALKAFTGLLDDDDRLLQGCSLTPRQRNAVRVRRGEKRVLMHYLALARDAIQERRSAPMIVAEPPETQSTDATAAERALCAWLRAEGGYIGPVAFRRENGLRGLFATRDIAKDEVVLRVPRHLILTVEAAQHSPIGLRLRGIDDMCTNGWIGAYLAAARRSAGPWQPLIDALPSSFPELPAFFDRADRAMLRGSEAEGSTRHRWKRVLQQFRQLRARLPRHERIPLRDFMWAHMASSTRAFGLTIDGAKATGNVPLADMMNHANDHNCTWSGDNTHHFDVRALRDVGRGTQLTIQYGAKTNARLLADYGFCIEDNPNEEVTLRYELDSSHWLHTTAPDLTEGATRLWFEIGNDPLSYHARKLFSFLRLVALPDAQAACGLAHVPKHRVPMLDVANEEAALRKLVAGCEQRLRRYPCSVEADEELLSGGTLTPIQRNVVLVRRGEKRLLQQTCGIARDALAMLQRSPVNPAVPGLWKKYFQDLAALLRNHCP